MTELAARSSVQKVEKFLNRAKFDELGEFHEKSVTVQPSSRKKGKLIPMFWSEITKYQESETCDECLIVALRISDDDHSLDFYNCDLLITARDINECNFRKQLGKCLLTENSTVYIEISNLTIRGSDRLMAILRDFKALFDNRVCVVLISNLSCVSSKVFSRFAVREIDVETAETPKNASKKRKASPSDESELLSKLEESENVVLVLRKEMQLSGSQFRNLETLHEKLQQEYEAVKNEAATSHSKNSKMEDKLQAMIKEQAVNQSKMEEERDILRRQTDDMITKMKEKHDAAVNESNFNHKRLVEELDDLKKINVDVQSEIEEYKLKETDLNKVNIELKEKNEHLEDEMLKLRNNVNVGVESVPDVDNNLAERRPLLKENETRQSNSTEAVNMDLEISRERAQLIKMKISKIRAECHTAGSHEILRKCFKKLVCDVKFSHKPYCEDSFVCTMKIVEIDQGYENFTKVKWEGKGKSKKIAKREAFLSLIKSIE